MEIKHDNMTIILGPPGTGKTTKLLSIIDSYIKKGINPNNIGFFTFTRKAANEAKDRAAAKFNISQKDLQYFNGSNISSNFSGRVWSNAIYRW